MRIKILCLTALLLVQPAAARQNPQTDATTPLHQLRPDYPVPYGVPRTEEVARVLDLIHAYLDAARPWASSTRGRTSR